MRFTGENETKRREVPAIHNSYGLKIALQPAPKTEASKNLEAEGEESRTSFS